MAVRELSSITQSDFLSAATAAESGTVHDGIVTYDNGGYWDLPDSYTFTIGTGIEWEIFPSNPVSRNPASYWFAMNSPGFALYVYYDSPNRRTTVNFNGNASTNSWSEGTFYKLRLTRKISVSGNTETDELILEHSPASGEWDYVHASDNLDSLNNFTIRGYNITKLDWLSLRGIVVGGGGGGEPSGGTGVLQMWYAPDSYGTTGYWIPVMTQDRPMKLRMKNKSWITLGNGGGAPLFVKTKNHGWIKVSSEGSLSRFVVGTVGEFDAFGEYGLPGKLVFAEGRRYDAHYTNGAGQYSIQYNVGQINIPWSSYVTAEKSNLPQDYKVEAFTATRANPIAVVDFWWMAPTYGYTNRLAVITPNQLSSGSTGDSMTATRYPSFQGDVGWRSLREDTKEIIGVGSGEEGVTEVGYAAPQPWADTVSSTGWTGDEWNTHTREIQEQVFWYPLPIGMMLQSMAIEYQNNLMASLAQNGNYFGVENATLERIEVIHYLTGFSVEKSQKPWMNFYNHASTTIGLWGGVGWVRNMGTMSNQDVQLFLWNGGYYNLSTARDLPFERTTEGTVVWGGSLNDVGIQTFDEYHGLPNSPMFTVTESFSPGSFGPNDSIMYHYQTSPLPDPTPIALINTDDSHTWHNRLGVTKILVRAVYLYH